MNRIFLTEFSRSVNQLALLYKLSINLPGPKWRNRLRLESQSNVSEREGFVVRAAQTELIKDQTPSTMDIDKSLNFHFDHRS